MVVIDNGGADPRQAIVTSVNRLQVEAEASRREFFISRDNEQVYHAVSSDATALANEEILYIQNTSATKRLFVGEIILTSDVAIRFQIKKVTGTAAGTVITPVNLNLTSSNAAEANVRGDGGVTGLTDDGILFICRSLAGSSRLANFADTLILGQNQAIAIETFDNANIDINIDFHLE